MNTDDYINELIDREKQVKHNPYLATRIMAKIEMPIYKVAGVLRYAAVAASFSLVVILGIAIGNSNKPMPQEYAGININDSEIENFALYNSDSNE